MWKTLSKIILSNRFLIILIIISLTAFMLDKGQDVKLSYSMAKLLPSDHEASINYESFLNSYGVQNILVIALENSQLTDYENLIALDSLTREVQQIVGVENIISLTNLPILLKDTVFQKFVVDTWFSSNIRSQAEMDSALSNFYKQPLYKNLITTSDNTATILLVSLEDNIVRSASREQLIYTITELVEVYSRRYSATPHFSGLPYIRTIDSLRVKKEITIFILLALLITAVILFLFFRSFKAMISSIIVVIVGVIFSFGTIALLNYEISIFMALVPPVIIVIGIPNCVFLINKFHVEFLRSNNKEFALKVMIQKIGNITLLTNLTTSAGFASFLLTNSKTLQEFGVIASLNILCIFLLSLFIIPIYFSLASTPKKRHTQHLNKKWIRSLVFFLVLIVRKKRKYIYIITAGLLILGFFGVTKIRTTGNLTDDLPKNQALYQDLKFLENNFGGVMPLEVLVDTKKKRGLLKSYNLKKIEELNHLLATYPEFSKPISYIEILKHCKQAYYNGDSLFYSLPNSQEQSLLFSYFKNSVEGLAITNLLTDSLMQTARITLRVADISTSRMDSVFAELLPQIDKIFDPEKYDVIITGSSIVFLTGTKFLLRNLMTSLLLVIVLISVFMAWMFNSFRMVVVSIIPNLIPLFLTAAIMGYFGIALKPSTILVFSIAFGISVDDTIHFLAKYRQELLANNLNVRKSVFSALKETGVSMFYTSVVLFFGFFIFVASDFGGTIALGLLVSITLMIAMLANLLLLPALLLSLEKVIYHDPMLEKINKKMGSS
tara:strand:+ start:4232 stop:6571 length:2340 start_codon:yes stop_codon:yes gene_type:complete